MIKWCIYLRAQSQGTYETMRNTGCIKLPSQRTLRDYTHHLECGAGFSAGVDTQLYNAAKLDSCNERDRYVMLLLDEMHVKQELVYDKHSGELVGFVNLGNLNMRLLAWEQSVSTDTTTASSAFSTSSASHATSTSSASHATSTSSASHAPPSASSSTSSTSQILASTVLVMMVKGLFTRLEFPYVHFPCKNLTGEQMYKPFWDAVCRLEGLGFKVQASVHHDSV